MIPTGCLIPEKFPVVSKFLSMKDLAESPPLTVVIGTVSIGRVLLLATVSNGIASVTVLSQCTGFSWGGAHTCDTLGLVGVIFGP